MIQKVDAAALAAGSKIVTRPKMESLAWADVDGSGGRGRRAEFAEFILSRIPITTENKKGMIFCLYEVMFAAEKDPFSKYIVVSRAKDMSALLRVVRPLISLEEEWPFDGCVLTSLNSASDWQSMKTECDLIRSAHAAGDDRSPESAYMAYVDWNEARALCGLNQYAAAAVPLDLCLERLEKLERANSASIAGRPSFQVITRMYRTRRCALAGDWQGARSEWRALMEYGKSHKLDAVSELSIDMDALEVAAIDGDSARFHILSESIEQSVATSKDLPATRKLTVYSKLANAAETVGDEQNAIKWALAAKDNMVGVTKFPAECLFVPHILSRFGHQAEAAECSAAAARVAPEDCSNLSLVRLFKVGANKTH